jgi:hypothetical protein
MKLVHRIVVAAVLAWLGSSGLALAEPISITSGVLTLLRQTNHGLPMTLTGTDGVRSFAFSGLVEGDLAWGAEECRPCRPTATDLSIVAPGAFAHGEVTYGPDSYTVPGGDFDGAFLTVQILGRASIPPSPPAVDVATVTAPFTMTGFLGAPFSGGQQSRNTLVGSGVATVQLVNDTSFSPAAWFFNSAEYRFTAADPGPVPEPATILLCGSGLALAVLRRRRKANGPHT